VIYNLPTPIPSRPIQLHGSYRALLQCHPLVLSGPELGSGSCYCDTTFTSRAGSETTRPFLPRPVPPGRDTIPYLHLLHIALLFGVLTSLLLSELSAREHPVGAVPIAAQADHALYAPPNFANHLQSASDGSGIKSSPGPATLSHGYSHAQLPQGEAHIHPELRSSHEPPPTTPVYAPIPNMIPSGPGVSHPNQAVPMQGPPSVVAPAGGSPEAEGADGRKAKRELSQSKRAAQNRAAQVSKQTPFLT
jgi:hypothetical protein